MAHAVADLGDDVLRPADRAADDPLTTFAAAPLARAPLARAALARTLPGAGLGRGSLAGLAAFARAGLPRARLARSGLLGARLLRAFAAPFARCLAGLAALLGTRLPTDLRAPS